MQWAEASTAQDALNIKRPKAVHTGFAARRETQAEMRRQEDATSNWDASSRIRVQPLCSAGGVVQTTRQGLQSCPQLLSQPQPKDSKSTPRSHDVVTSTSGTSVMSGCRRFNTCCVLCWRHSLPVRQLTVFPGCQLQPAVWATSSRARTHADTLRHSPACRHTCV